MDRPGAVAALRSALAAFERAWAGADDRWCVALSGGADSLALTAVAAELKPTTALIVDHQLQPGSAEVAQTARRQALQLGCVAARILRVQVGTAGGPEAAARTARYEALSTARGEAPVLLGHTLDDQAETVLLGLGRGSGPRSIAGMRPHDPPWYRPLLGVRRSVTVAACAELGLTPWQDPHNADPRFTRSRLRTEVMPLLEEVLGGGVAEALARTAAALREDTDALDELAARELRRVVVGGEEGGETGAATGLDARALERLPTAIRRRVIRVWLLDGGAANLSDHQIRAVDTLVTGWRGQGGVAVGSPLRRQRLIAARRDGVLRLHREPV
ncbi:tRNA lysidine(34) synthetase TilS [Mycolicibacterium thermoresistibile]|jgi:tRNA(Ile)-lysidine synthase|uniref:tRNA(Ile)-lysidine synthase n=2 Tax=Mycolicibacterium thermoresistibile TaxID=1797 RepID=G7CF29_MYCT3|nr:tRNA lysidine(34) synthetase TilS [Mycolicibacterium thermoresistibile]EHI13108.1 tRNA(Ile)-lysidine synthase [Mycolicibacterium thermoresistibile ATCC 19527]MCV7187080.1 tRNA lysidine(34) synthetase TilS [Mycolicibacterium thermoresistibile]GAT16334.1 cell cycle protein mesJ [Mycolicibacterium thermoresistibile]SNW20294.1 tRNA(Ile)-lysidine synthetase [Mycolicibacterium thermoresistibile]